MTKEEIEELIGLAASMGLYDDKNPCKRAVILGKAIETLQQMSCTDVISRQAVHRQINKWVASGESDNSLMSLHNRVDTLPSVASEWKWIPVSERLPKVADCYAVTRKIGDDLIVSACYFDGINIWHDDNWINHERNYLTDIIAWCELPEEYKPER